LGKNGSSKEELVVRVFKKHAADQGMTLGQARDEALCAGWIDGPRIEQDEDSATVRFAPRRSKSLWSGVNLKRYQELVAQGRVTARGEAAWCDRHSESTERYSQAVNATALTPALALEFRRQSAAWKYYQSTAAGYRRASAAWVMGAQRDATRRRRLQVLIESSAAKKYIPLLRK
jgi:uncharacterized protein YdeI (YjbR/CyaY-like superfamily)